MRCRKVLRVRLPRLNTTKTPKHLREAAVGKKQLEDCHDQGAIAYAPREQASTWQATIASRFDTSIAAGVSRPNKELRDPDPILEHIRDVRRDAVHTGQTSTAGIGLSVWSGQPI